MKMRRKKKEGETSKKRTVAGDQVWEKCKSNVNDSEKRKMNMFIIHVYYRVYYTVYQHYTRRKSSKRFFSLLSDMKMYTLAGCNYILLIRHLAMCGMYYYDKIEIYQFD